MDRVHATLSSGRKRAEILEFGPDFQQNSLLKRGRSPVFASRGVQSVAYTAFKQ
jgi:hypothetical protein